LVTGPFCILLFARQVNGQLSIEREGHQAQARIDHGGALASAMSGELRVPGCRAFIIVAAPRPLPRVSFECSGRQTPARYTVEGGTLQQREALAFTRSRCSCPSPPVLKPSSVCDSTGAPPHESRGGCASGTGIGRGSTIHALALATIRVTSSVRAAGWMNFATSSMIKSQI